MQAAGNLSKMKTALGEPVQYHLHLGEDVVPMNDLIGQRIQMNFDGLINCIACGRVTKKVFGQGFCYPCFMNSPENSECIIRPELCLAHEGKGRDVEWEKEHHLQPHIVYLALTDVVKVGVTRVPQVPTRWIDQGAWKAIRLAAVPYRQLAGAIEVFLKDYLADKTNWRKMLKNEMNESLDLVTEKKRIATILQSSDLKEYLSNNDEVVEMAYPVEQYPQKVKSISFDKLPEIAGVLHGIRGQYLLLDEDRVLNIRKHNGYFVTLQY